MKTLGDLAEVLHLSERKTMMMNMVYPKVAATAGNIMAVLQAAIDVEEAAIAMGLYSLPRADVGSGLEYGEY